MNQGNQLRADQWIPAAVGAVLIAFFAIVTFFLLTEHRAHTFGVLPWLLLLACPFLHIFMHRGHGKGRGGHAGHRALRPNSSHGGKP